MNDEKVTGYCYTNNVSSSDKDIWSADRRKARTPVRIILAVFAVGAIVFSIWSHFPAFLLLPLVLLLLLAAGSYSLRYGYSVDTTFELSESCIRTEAVSKKMCRRFSWAEVSMIQNTRIGDPMRAHPFPSMICYVFVRGKDNALADSSEIHSFRQVVSNPDRIVIPKDSRTVDLVTAIAEKYRIPIR